MDEILILVAPRKEINILLLCETGAGKSTFINALVNYFKFNSLEDAISGEIDMEDEDDVSDGSIGESSTQECDTLLVLKRQLQKLQTSDIERQTCKDTIYCFDNESFKFLAASKKGMVFTDNEKRNYASSWEKSKRESIEISKKNIAEVVKLKEEIQKANLTIEELS
ncbi:14922_t:CDS:2, partial [Racocetra persica]